MNVTDILWFSKDSSRFIWGSERSGYRHLYLYNIDGGTFASNRIFTGLATGAHTIQIKDQNNCQGDTTVVLKNTSYKLDVAATAKPAWCDAGGLAGSVSINAEGGSMPYGYFWQNLPTGKGPEMTDLPKGTYKVTVTDKYGCSGDATAIVEENFCCSIWLPNAFTPNNDSRNDKFQAIANRAIPKYEMSIYNRWGQRIFYSADPAKGWDGTWNGTPVASGTYMFSLSVQTGTHATEEHYKGDITLIR